MSNTTANGAGLVVSYTSRRVLLAIKRLQTALVCVVSWAAQG
jgi:hypothetical protein